MATTTMSATTVESATTAAAESTATTAVEATAASRLEATAASPAAKPSAALRSEVPAIREPSAIEAPSIEAPAVEAPPIEAAAIKSPVKESTSTESATEPRTRTDEDAIHEVIWSPITVRGASVRGIRVVAIGADRWSIITIVPVIAATYSNSYLNLRVRVARRKHANRQ